jgi:predicted nucleotidyltransferase component of viral defense system
MDPKVDYGALYELQERVLMACVHAKSGFYLTGGTCLHRFYKPRRHSDGLDLFCNEEELYRQYVRGLKGELAHQGLEQKVEVDTRDFVRFQVGSMLRVDLVNDRLPYIGQVRRTPEGFRIDNIENILANKITAVVGRDDPKDLFDIVTITRIARFDWMAMLEAASRKSYFEKDYFVYRLRFFPLQLLDALAVIKGEYLSETKEALPRIIDDILMGRVNEPMEAASSSWAGKASPEGMD